MRSANSLEGYLEGVDNVLLVEPCYPIPSKSRNHHNFLPIGLLKIAGYLREEGKQVSLERYDPSLAQTHLLDHPTGDGGVDDSQLILVTSLFTYWAGYVRDAVHYYKRRYPHTPILVGGVYASLLPEHCREYTGCTDVITGVIPRAEKAKPAYDLVDVDYQILHASRGCIRNCNFCMVYKVEPQWICKHTIRDEVVKKKLVFYDNNLLANPYIEDLLSELIQLRREKVITRCESQSGFDGRVLREKPHLAQLLHEAGFKNPRIAWDGSVTLYQDIQEMVQILVDAGYKHGDISIFMIYNYNLTYTEVETKRSLIYQLGCQVNDCRYHPTTQTYDNYNPHKYHQSSRDYYIHPRWTDREVRLFRKNCRRHNICIRYRMSWHHPLVEYRQVDPRIRDMYREMSWEEIQSYLPDAWNPKEIHTKEET